MRVDYEGPGKRERRGITEALRAYVFIFKIAFVIAILLMGAHIINQLDDVMEAQRIQDETMTDAMDQLMWIRMDILVLEEQIYMLEYDVEALAPEVSPQSYYPLTREERELVERIVASEARGEPLEGIMAVAQVIRDRSRLWGMSVTEVCLAPGQFADPYHDEVSQEVVQAVWAVFDEGMSAFAEPVTHFHAKYVDPYWSNTKVCRGQIGAHRFYQ